MDAWRTWPLEEREREYTPSSMIPSLLPWIREYEASGARAIAWGRERRLLRSDLRYGEGPDEALDLFLPERTPSGRRPVPLVVFFHGGYWQELRKEDGDFAAPELVSSGIAYASVDYTLAPAASLARIVDQARRSVDRLRADAPQLGIDPARIVLAGHSAGAHLAAMVLLADAAAGPSLPLAGGVLVSGIFELEPLVGTSINDALGLDVETARMLDPHRALAGGEGRSARSLAPVVVAWGDSDTAEFRRQGHAFAAAWRGAGGEAEMIELPERHHFDVILELGAEGTQLGEATRRLALGRGR